MAKVLGRIGQNQSDDIATMNVTKENNKSIIRIVTKDKTTESKKILILISKKHLGLENVDPNNKYSSKTKKRKHLQKNYEINGIPTEYFIDGKK
jgi:hypothetical protein